MYAMDPDTIVSPRVVVVLGSLAWVFALIDLGIDAAFPPHRRVDQE